MQLSGRRAGLIVAIALVGAAVLTVVVLARPASAALSTAAPASGARVDVPPSAVSLAFTTAVAQAHVRVSGGAESGEPVIDGVTVRQPVKMTKAGRYVVVYHVVTQDGSELQGRLWFTVAGAEAPAGPDPELPPEWAGSHHGGALDALTAAIIGVNVLAVLVLGVLFVLRGRRLSGGAPRSRRCDDGSVTICSKQAVTRGARRDNSTEQG
jgi:methionine-rich copper-binding protein CopC